MTKSGSVYHKTFPSNQVDIYRILREYVVTDPCIQHAVKKLLCAGNRSGGKTREQDIQEAIDSLTRFLAMEEEDRT